MIFHSSPTIAGFSDMASYGRPSRSPSPATQPATLTMADLSTQFSAYSLDGVSQPSKQGQDYSFMVDQPILFHQPNYLQSGTASSTVSQSEPSSPTAEYSPALPAASSPALPSLYNSSSYTSTSASRIRQQRQRAVRRQCSEGHLREISALVARMVAGGEQCSIHGNKTPSLSRASSSDAPSEAEQGTVLQSLSDSCEEPDMILDDDEDEDDDDDDADPQHANTTSRSKYSSDNARTSLSSGAISSRLARLRSRYSIADLTAQPSMRDGISKNALRSKRSILNRRRAVSTTVQEE